MSRSIIPWKRNRISAATRRDDPFTALQQQMNELFDDFFSSSPLALSRGFGSDDMDQWFGSPNVDLTEDNREITLTADLPGVDEKDIKVTLDHDVLTINAQKTEEKDEKDKRYHLSERRYGSFSRSFRLPENVVKEEDIKARFKNGVLRLSLPKREDAPAESRRQIAISSEE
jgi:HSP20 family protein